MDGVSHWETIAHTKAGTEVRRLLIHGGWWCGDLPGAIYRCGELWSQADYWAGLDAEIVAAFQAAEDDADLNAAAEDGRAFAWMG